MTMRSQTSPLQCIEINSKNSPVGSVIWMHGLGADANDFVPIVSELNLPADLPLRFIFPNAPEIPVTINNGYVMRAWFDIVSMNFEHRVNHDGVFDMMASISELIKNEEQRGIPADKIILAGFSQGAVMAMATGLTYPKRLGGVLALSGFLPDAKEIFSIASEANKSLPIFLAHGTQDFVVPYLLGERTRDILQNYSYPVEWHSYSMAHSVCGEEVVDIRNWLERVFVV